MHEPGMQEAAERQERREAALRAKSRFLKECKEGLHKLEVIHETAEDGAGCSEVVRWCPLCGSVVVDLDIDNRTQKGGIMPMRRPEILERASLTFIV